MTSCVGGNTDIWQLFKERPHKQKHEDQQAAREEAGNLETHTHLYIHVRTSYETILSFFNLAVLTKHVFSTNSGLETNTRPLTKCWLKPRRAGEFAYILASKKKKKIVCVGNVFKAVWDTHGAATLLSSIIHHALGKRKKYT